MKLSKIEWIVMKLLAASVTPLSIAELAEQSPFRFAPKAIITLAVETLLHKKLIREAGIHKSYSGGKENSYVLYAPACEPGEA